MAALNFQIAGLPIANLKNIAMKNSKWKRRLFFLFLMSSALMLVIWGINQFLWESNSFLVNEAFVTALYIIFFVAFYIGLLSAAGLLILFIHSSVKKAQNK